MVYMRSRWMILSADVSTRQLRSRRTFVADRPQSPAGYRTAFMLVSFGPLQDPAAPLPQSFPRPTPPHVLQSVHSNTHAATFVFHPVFRCVLHGSLRRVQLVPWDKHHLEGPARLEVDLHSGCVSRFRNYRVGFRYRTRTPALANPTAATTRSGHEEYCWDGFRCKGSRRQRCG